MEMPNETCDDCNGYGCQTCNYGEGNPSVPKSELINDNKGETKMKTVSEVAQIIKELGFENRTRIVRAWEGLSGEDRQGLDFRSFLAHETRREIQNMTGKKCSLKLVREALRQ